MHLLLIRHGQSYVNLVDWDQGYIDTGLTDLGRQQAGRVAAWLAARVQATALYTSTMARARETAAIVARALDLAAQPDDRLREFGNCYADGQPVPPEAMPIQYADFWGSERPYTRISAEGESWGLFRLRVGVFLDDVIARHGGDDPPATVVVVAHGGIVEATFDYVFNVGAHRRVEVMTHSTAITHFEHRPESGRETWRLHAQGLPLHLLAEDDTWLGSRPVLRDATRPGSEPEQRGPDAVEPGEGDRTSDT